MVKNVRRGAFHLDIRKPDFVILGLAAALVFAGVLILASVSSSFSLQRTGDTFYFLQHQILAGLLPGIILGAIAYALPISFFKRFSFFFFCVAILLMVLVFLPSIGSSSGGAYRWIGVGSFTFQPSEALKLAAILYFASLLSSRLPALKSGLKKKIPTGKTIKEVTIPFLGALAITSVLLLRQPNLSTLIIIAATALILYFSANTPFWHTPLIFSAGLVLAGVFIKLAPYRLNRWLVFLDPSTDPLGKGYQIKQALIGIGSGGLTGVGLGLSFQKFGVLPEPVSDSIFAVFAEEAGFLGAAGLILLFLAFGWRSFWIARKATDEFGRLLAIGIPSWILLQTFVNMGAMLRIVPLTGIPLPFISYGGSALMIELVAIGILLNISKDTQRV